MMETIGMGLPGGPEVLIILFVILLLFGAKKLPELSRALGKSLGEFKKGKDDLEREIRDVQTDFHKASEESEINVEPIVTEEKASESESKPDQSGTI